MDTSHFEKSDTALIEAICGSLAEREAALHFIFNNESLFQRVVNYVLNQGGSQYDGEDVFQESVIIFDRSIREGKFKGNSSLQTYFFGITKWYFYTERRKQKTFIALNDQYFEVEDDFESGIIKEDEQELLHGILAQIGTKCKDLLQMASITKSNKELAALKNFSSADMARKEVYRCREKLRTLIKHPHLNLTLKLIIRK